MLESWSSATLLASVGHFPNKRSAKAVALCLISPLMMETDWLFHRTGFLLWELHFIGALYVASSFWTLLLMEVICVEGQGLTSHGACWSFSVVDLVHACVRAYEQSPPACFPFLL